MFDASLVPPGTVIFTTSLSFSFVLSGPLDQCSADLGTQPGRGCSYQVRVGSASDYKEWNVTP